MYSKREKQNWPQIIEAVAKMVNARIINTKNSKHNGAAHDCNANCKMDCYVYGCADAGTPDCNLFEKLPDTGVA